MKITLPLGSKVLIRKINNLEKNVKGLYENIVFKSYVTKKELIFNHKRIKEINKFLPKSNLPKSCKYLNESLNNDIIFIDTNVRLKSDDYLILTIETQLKLNNNLNYSRKNKNYVYEPSLSIDGRYNRKNSNDDNNVYSLSL